MMPDLQKMPSLAPRRALWLALAGLVAITAIRLVVASVTPLSPDESYYWLWAKPLQLSYYDHPGMVGWWIWAGVHLFGNTPLGVRLPAVASSAVVTILVWDATRVAFDSSRAGIVAALWLNATVLFGAGAVLITPDAPLLLFWMAALWALLRLIESSRPVWLYVAAVALGLGVDSKYTIALFVPGALLMFVAAPELRRWWRSRHIWLALMLALILTLPVWIWNTENGFVSIRKQLAHAAANSSQTPIANFGAWLGGQIGLITPLIFAFALWGMARLLWVGWRQRRSSWLLIAAVSLPVIAFFGEHSFTQEVQAHWDGPAWLAAMMMAAGAAPGLSGRRWVRNTYIAAPVLGLILVALVYFQATTALVPIPPRADPLKQLGGWDSLAAAVQSDRDAHPGVFLLASKHETEGLMGFLLPDHAIVFGMGGSFRPSHYSASDVAALKGHDALLILRSRDNDAQGYARAFDGLEKLQTVPLAWGGRPADSYDVWLGHAYRGGLIVEGDGANAALDSP